ncbi:MAG: ABC transporter permease [Peptoniphilaceae bacterium]|nr:ABC transporter permease [Peptoniphilaceae bacterium]MDY5765707.1 ABC transporter permease [Peptoniphilaceae bacterium]
MALWNSLPGAVAQGMIWGILAIGVYLTFRILDIPDLTVDGSIATGGAVCIMMMRSGIPAHWSMAAAFFVGMVAGAVTGLFHTKCHIPAILAGILTQLALYSVNLRILMSKANQPISVDRYYLMVSQRFARALNFENPMIPLTILLALLIAILYWFFGTEEGGAIRATGANAHMARAQGINTDHQIVLGLMLSNGLVAVAGALLAQYQGAADINMGRGAIVIGLAAVIIGEVLFERIFRNFALKMLSVVIGSIVYYLILQFVLQMGLNTNDLKLVTALIVAIFLTLPNIKNHFATRKIAGRADSRREA